VRRFRLLASEIEIRTDCPRLDRALDYLVPHAEQDWPLHRRFAFAADRDGEGYAIGQDGAVLEREPDPQAALFNLFRRVNEAAFSVMPAVIRLHAGSGRRNGRRFLVVGDRAAGKTTLMLRLLFDGWEIHGDELVMLRDGVAIAYPRRFHVKKGTIGLLPEIAARIATLPYVEYPDGYRIAAFDPTEAGYGWRLTPGPPDVVLFAESGHGRPSALREMAKLEMVRRVMTQTIAPDEPSWNWIGDLARTLDRARCCHLAVGDLDSAVLAMQQALL
jgi:hypothetical protein